MPLLSNLAEIRDELRVRIDEAVVGEYDDVDLNFFIRHAADRVAKQIKHRRITPLFLRAGKRIDLGRFRFIEMWDQLQTYQQYEYRRVTAVPSGANQPSPLSVYVDRLYNRIFHAQYTPTGPNADVVHMVAGESSLWHSSITLSDTVSPSNILNLASSSLFPEMIVIEGFGDRLWRFDKGTMTELPSIQIVGGALTSGAIHANAYGDPLANTGFGYFTDPITPGVWQVNIATGATVFTATTGGAYQMSMDEEDNYAAILCHNIGGSPNDEIYKLNLSASPTLSTALAGYNGALGQHALDKENDYLYTLRDAGGILTIAQIDMSTTAPTFVVDTALTLPIPQTAGRGTYAVATGEAVFTMDNLVLFFNPATGQYRTLEMPSLVFGIDYDEITGSLWVTTPAAPYLYRIDLVGIDRPGYIPTIPRGQRWDHLDSPPTYALVQESISGQPTLEIVPDLTIDLLVEMRYASLPHEMIVDATPCDIPQEMREAIVAEAEILAYERRGRDASWLQSKLQNDYRNFSSWEFQRSMSEYASTSTYD